MGRSRRSTYTATIPRKSRYNLRSRTKKPDYMARLADIVHKDPSVKLPKIEKIDMKISENAADHNTKVYDEADCLVVRRGQVFKFSIKLKSALEDGQHMKLILTTGRTPYPSRGTLLQFGLLSSEAVKSFMWECESAGQDKTTIDISMRISPEALIGEYQISVQVCGSGDHIAENHKKINKFVVLFNPWSLNDDVFMSDEAERNEYVFNETGRIWVGNKTKHYGKPWMFGQFEGVVLEAALYLLSISDLSDEALSNPVIISRTLSKLSNNFDDNGVLEGNWSGDYSGGVEPTDWNSSVDILTEYMKEKREVKYGQCWVFSALLTSLFRSLGIPARSVTNFESAHDNDGSMTVDRHWDIEGEPLSDLNDSIWNFHVWNEVWTRRNDLPTGYNGWQAVDGTPQELSEGVMQCGPAPVEAIKNGDVYLPYDCKFVFAEVNGDIIEWVQDKDGSMSIWSKQPHSVGFNISTKAVGTHDRLDLTHNYKYPEGSAKERDVVKKVSNFSTKRESLLDVYSQDQEEKVKFDLYGEGFNNGDIEIHLKLRWTSGEKLTVKAAISCVAGYYNGMTSDVLLSSRHELKLDPGKDSHDVIVTLKGEDYLNKIATDATISVFCKADVVESGQHFFKRENVFIDRPDVEIDAPSRVTAHEKFNVNISFTNQLSIDLTQCKFKLSGPGISCAASSFKLPSSTIKSGETMNKTITITARHIGMKEIICMLTTRQLQNVSGSCVIEITE